MNAGNTDKYFQSVQGLIAITFARLWAKRNSSVLQQ